MSDESANEIYLETDLDMSRTKGQGVYRILDSVAETAKTASKYKRYDIKLTIEESDIRVNDDE